MSERNDSPKRTLKSEPPAQRSATRLKPSSASIQAEFDDTDNGAGEASRESLAEPSWKSDFAGGRDVESRTTPRVGSSAPPPSHREADELMGQLIDSRYMVDALLDIGSMGIVYSGRHLAVGRRVAIKVLRRQFLTDEEVTRRFAAEATAATAIGNAHIVDTLDFGTLPNGSAYQVMEFLEGRSLGQELRAGQALPLERILNVGCQVAAALRAAHEAGIVHRDLKPDNVFLVPRDGDSDFVKILDFGIAKFGAGQNKLTHAGAVFGTPNYMAPEQALGRATDPRTDIYALGVILYQMAAGTVPFEGDSPVAVLTRHATEAPLPLGKHARGLPKRFELLVKKCLGKHPEERFQSMADLLEELERVRAGVELTMLPPPSAASEEAAVVSALRPNWIRRGSWALGGAALLSAVAYALTGSGPDVPAASRTSADSVAPVSVAPAMEPKPLQKPASLEPAPPSVPVYDVALVLFPLDAHVVVIGGADLGAMPVTVKVTEGQPVTVRIQRDGYWPRRLKLDGTKTRFVIGLVKKGAGSRPPPDSDEPNFGQSGPERPLSKKKKRSGG
jgi:eukaryotic-like serine/threonine-protein kinase